MENTLKLKLLSVVSSAGLSTDDAAQLVATVEAMQPADAVDMARLIIGAPSIAPELWESARARAEERHDDAPAEQLIATEVHKFRYALAEFL